MKGDVGFPVFMEDAVFVNEALVEIIQLFENALRVVNCSVTQCNYDRIIIFGGKLIRMLCGFFEPVKIALPYAEDIIPCAASKSTYKSRMVGR